MRYKLNFIDLFSGAGGLSEGFIRQGFNAISHVEMDKASCNTLLTRTAFHYLVDKGDKDIYIDYLKQKITRKELYHLLPEELKKSVINEPISANNNDKIFERIDIVKGNKEIDLIIGGPPC